MNKKCNKKEWKNSIYIFMKENANDIIFQIDNGEKKEYFVLYE